MTQAQLTLDQSWAGNIPPHWRWSRNKELLVESVMLSADGSEELLSVSHLTGITPRSEKNVTMSAGEDLGGYRLVAPGDVVINTMWAWMGALGVSRQRGIVSPAYGVYRPRLGAQFEPHFYDYFYRSESYVMEMTRLSRGIWSSRLRLYPDVFLGMAVPVPPLEEQRAIANYLDREAARIDTLIGEQQRLIEMLRERRAAVLEATFDAGPPTEPTKVGRLLSSRPSYGVLVPRYVDEEAGVPFVRVGDLLHLAPDRPMQAIEPAQSDEYARTKIAGGEVLLGVVGKMGQAAVAPKWLAGANVARAVVVLRCKDPELAPLVCAWLGSSSFLHQAELATSGDSIQPTLGMKDLARFDINLPTSPGAAKNLVGRLSKIDALIVEAERFIELSKERRAALITAAVTGQIDVREVA